MPLSFEDIRTQRVCSALASLRRVVEYAISGKRSSRK